MRFASDQKQLVTSFPVDMYYIEGCAEEKFEVGYS